MISLLLLVISVIFYWIAEKYYSRREYDMVHFETKGSILCIISIVFFLGSTAMAIYSAYKIISNGG